jgi:hypothetical protein
VSSGRIKHLIEFYSILDALQNNLGGTRTLVESSGRMIWPRRGVYFFFEHGEQRSDSGEGPRVVRVGTHALKTGSATKLWTRLSQHKGQISTGGGNHRGSIFRLIIGSALIARHGYMCGTWGTGKTAKGEVRKQEQTLEHEVSKVIGSMAFLWLAVKDEAGPKSQRCYIEKNTIALLSNYRKDPLDPASRNWLGRHSDRDRVKRSGLWNSNHVEDSYDPAFLEHLRQLVSDTGSTS